MSSGTETETESYRLALALGLAALLATLLRGFAFLGEYPSGADYGHHLLAADHYLEHGQRMLMYPWYQLGETRYAHLPGAAMLYGLLAAGGGTTPFVIAPLTAALAAVEVGGVFLLARRLYGPGPSPLLAALVSAVFPTGVAMTSWAAYANLVGIALMPYALLAWLEHWTNRGPGTSLRAAIAVAAMAGVHHLSIAWLGLSLGLFTLTMLVLRPRETFARLSSLALPLCFLALPAAARVVDMVTVSRTAGFARTTEQIQRFDATRVDWTGWVNMTSPLSLLLAVGVLALLLDRHVRREGRLLVASYTVVTLALMFGWLFGFVFYYVRAVYFLALPIALGAPALVRRAGGAVARRALAALLLTGLGVSTIAQAERESRFYTILTPAVVEAVARLEGASAAGDVVACSAVFGFHLPRLIERPLLAALSPDLVGNADELPMARDAVAIVTAAPGMERVLDARRVAFVLLSRRFPDAGAKALAVHPRMERLLENEDAVLYRVHPR